MDQKDAGSSTHKFLQQKIMVKTQSISSLRLIYHITSAADSTVFCHIPHNEQ
jgi:hypothetical protein